MDKNVKRFSRKKTCNGCEDDIGKRLDEASSDTSDKASVDEVEVIDDKIELELAPKRGPLTVGKQKKVLETSLDFVEKKQLKESIEIACKDYKFKVAEKYTDDFNASIMISKEDTKIKNEILRKIKYYDMKKNNLPDLIRKKREDILAQREIKQR